MSEPVTLQRIPEVERNLREFSAAIGLTADEACAGFKALSARLHQSGWSVADVVAPFGAANA